MSERSIGVGAVVFRSLAAWAIVAGTAQQAVGDVTYTVDRSAGTARVTGTIVTNGAIGVLKPVDFVSWNLALDADGDGISLPLVGPPPVPPCPAPPACPPPGVPGVGMLGEALTATPTGLFWNFSASSPMGGPILFQLYTPFPSPGNDVVWQFMAGMLGMTNELVREGTPDNQTIVDGTGLVQIASTVIAPLEITADTTLAADRRGPIVIAADDVTLDCAHHVVTGSGSGVGIHAAGRRGLTIARCVVDGFGEGIVLEDSTESVLSENTATENVSVGIRLTDADGNRLTGNHVSFTRGPSGAANGIVLASSSRNQVEWNTVDHSDLAGILAGDGSQSNVFLANVSSLNGGPGFDLALSSSNTLKRNTATRNGEFGFVLRADAKRNKLFDNSACLNAPGDATELRGGHRSNANVWALNLFCSPDF